MLLSRRLRFRGVIGSVRCAKPQAMFGALFETDVENFDQEGPLVGDFFDDFGCWFACAVTGAGFDADEHRRIALMDVLQLGRKFETVAGAASFVLVCGGD